MDQCCEKLAACEKSMLVEMELLRRDLLDVKQAVASRDKSLDELTESVSGLVEAWNTGTGMVTFIKWLSTAIAAISLVWHAVKDFK